MPNDNQMPDFSAILNGSTEATPADITAALSQSTGVDVPAPPPGTVDPEQIDPATITDPGDPYETPPMEPDSAVSLPEPEPAAKPAEEPPSSPEPAPAAEPQDLTPVFTQALADYNAAAQAAQDAAAKLAELQNNAEGIVEFTPEMAAAMEAKMKSEANAERAFDEIADESIGLAIQNFPELADDNHPATIAVKNILAADPSLSTRSPTAVAELSVKIAADIRARSKATAPSQPKPAPGPVPPRAPLPSAAQASAAAAARPAPGQPAQPSLVQQIAASSSMDDFASLIDKTLGVAGRRVTIS
jgi:hypothetical protein